SFPESPNRNFVRRAYPVSRLLFWLAMRASCGRKSRRSCPVEHAAFSLNLKGDTHEEKWLMDFCNHRCRIVGRDADMEFFDAGGWPGRSKSQGARRRQQSS